MRSEQECLELRAKLRSEVDVLRMLKRRSAEPEYSTALSTRIALIESQVDGLSLAIGDQGGRNEAFGGGINHNLMFGDSGLFYRPAME